VRITLGYWTGLDLKLVSPSAAELVQITILGGLRISLLRREQTAVSWRLSNVLAGTCPVKFQRRPKVTCTRDFWLESTALSNGPGLEEGDSGRHRKMRE